MSIHDGLSNALKMMWDKPQIEDNRYLVHPTEYGWITNPVGPPPSDQAVFVALQVGAVDNKHPAVQALMSRIFGT